MSDDAHNLETENEISHSHFHFADVRILFSTTDIDFVFHQCRKVTGDSDNLHIVAVVLSTYIVHVRRPTSLVIAMFSYARQTTTQVAHFRTIRMSPPMPMYGNPDYFFHYANPGAGCGAFWHSFAHCRLSRRIFHLHNEYAKHRWKKRDEIMSIIVCCCCAQVSVMMCPSYEIIYCTCLGEN